MLTFLVDFLSFYYNYSLFRRFFFYFICSPSSIRTLDRAQIIDNISEFGVLVVDVNGFIIICE